MRIVCLVTLVVWELALVTQRPYHSLTPCPTTKQALCRLNNLWLPLTLEHPSHTSVFMHVKQDTGHMQVKVQTGPSCPPLTANSAAVHLPLIPLSNQKQHLNLANARSKEIKNGYLCSNATHANCAKGPHIKVKQTHMQLRERRSILQAVVPSTLLREERLNSGFAFCQTSS